MTFDEFKQEITSVADGLGLTDYELYYASSESTSVGIFQHEINNFSSSAGGGVSFRCLRNGRMGYASTEELSAEEAGRIVRAACGNADILETTEQEFLGEDGGTYRQFTPREITLPPVDTLVKTALAAQEALYSSDSQVIDGSESEIVSFHDTIAIVNSRGLDLFHENRNNVLISSAVVSDGKETNNDYKIRFGNLEEIDLAAVAQEAVTAAQSKLGAGVAPTGNYPVIFAPKAMCSLLAAFSGIFSSENVRRGLSRLKDREGEIIASETVTLTDDPFYADSPVQITFDAEGTPTCTKNIIERGELKTLFYNLKNAAAMGRKSTGNASRASYASAVGISPFTLRLAPGDLSEEELIRQTGQGVYIDFLGGLHAGADPISGDFSLQSAGFMIENGQKAGAVKSFTVAGNYYDLLRHVTAVSDKVILPGFGGMTNFASPAVCVEGLSIAGK